MNPKFFYLFFFLSPEGKRRFNISRLNDLGGEKLSFFLSTYRAVVVAAIAVVAIAVVVVVVVVVVVAVVVVFDTITDVFLFLDANL